MGAQRRLRLQGNQHCYYDATLLGLFAKGDTEMVVIIDYVLDVLGIQMDIVNVEETLL